MSYVKLVFNSLKNEEKGENTMYDVILFDLDGTLTDSGLGITNSVAYRRQNRAL